MGHNQSFLVLFDLTWHFAFVITLCFSYFPIRRGWILAELLIFQNNQLFSDCLCHPYILYASLAKSHVNMKVIHLCTFFSTSTWETLLSGGTRGSRMSSLTNRAGFSCWTLSGHYRHICVILKGKVFQLISNEKYSNKYCENMNTYLWSHNASRSRRASFALETLGGK